MTARIIQGDALERLRELPPGSVHAVVTSPAYWGLRKYRAGAQEMGSEATPEEHIERLVAVFREVRRVLRDDGTLWLNYGDSMNSTPPGNKAPASRSTLNGAQTSASYHAYLVETQQRQQEKRRLVAGMESLNLLGLPERLVLALQADGWVWRSTVAWAKPAPMPESVAGWRWEQHRVKVGTQAGAGKQNTHPGSLTALQGGIDLPQWAPCPGCPACAPHGGLVLRRGSWRPTRAWEPIFMLVKGSGYYGDGEAVKEKGVPESHTEKSWPRRAPGDDGRDGENMSQYISGFRNPRNVWVLPPEPCNWDFCLACGTWYGKGGWARRSIRRWSTRELDIETEEYKSVQHRRCAQCKAVDQFVDHYAAFPSELPRRCIAASTSERGVCPACGAPWARVVEHTTSGHDNNPMADLRISRVGPDWALASGTQTLGWRATCTCNAGEPVPATVLDPFMGTATTLLAASQLGRDAIGIDLSERYCALAEARLAADAPLLELVQ